MESQKKSRNSDFLRNKKCTILYIIFQMENWQLWSKQCLIDFTMILGCSWLNFLSHSTLYNQIISDNLFTLRLCFNLYKQSLQTKVFSTKTSNPILHLSKPVSHHQDHQYILEVNYHLFLMILEVYYHLLLMNLIKNPHIKEW